MTHSTAPTVAWHPARSVLDLAELVVTGALESLPADLELPVEIAIQARSGAVLQLEDAEGTPVVALHPGADAGQWKVEPLRPFAHGPLRPNRQPPAQVRAQVPAGAVAVPVARALSAVELEQVRSAQTPVLWMVMTGSGRRVDLGAQALWRATTEVAGTDPVVVVAAPVLADAEADATMLRSIAQAYGASSVLSLPATAASPAGEASGASPRILAEPFARELAATVVPADRRGLTLFFTGLSGSGKSTVAKALAEAIELDGRRKLSLLDGDEVRRLLSAGLSFSRADRDLNIRRIGFVATEVTRHGGIAICAPIAPFAQVRDEVRSWVSEVGDFVLVHINTPLEECERRDRKGLYAKARAGEIPDFTGISSPYEAPTDADLVIDTSLVSVPEAVALLTAFLAERGYLPAR